MATITVTNLDDSGAGSLRQAIIDANNAAGDDTIQFQAGLSGTITLSGELDITTSMSINGDTDGDRKADITISGNNFSRIFDISGGATAVVLSSLSLTNGNPITGGNGGAILADGAASLVVIDSTISDSRTDAIGEGGAIAASQVGSFSMIGSTISGNGARNGGGLFIESSTARIVNSTVDGNTALGDTFQAGAGGGIRAFLSTLTIDNSTISDNAAADNGIGGNQPGQGGGLSTVSMPVTIQNSVIAGNTATLMPDLDTGANAAVANSFFSTSVIIGTNNGGIIGNGGDAKLGALADNGGPVMTRMPLADSPLVGAGNAALLPADTFNLDGDGDTAEPLPLDAARTTRVVGTLDIGAAESRHFVVNTLLDVVDANDGLLSLREAVTLANSTSGSWITFAEGLSGTIELTGELALTSSVSILGDTDGDRKADITLSGEDAHRIFNISGADMQVVLRSLTLTDGATTGAGGAIQALGGTNAVLALVDSTIRDSTATIDGGGIHSEVTLTIVSSLITNNSSNFGGGIHAQTGTTIGIANSTIHGNNATTDGGGINTGGNNTVNILNSTITNNTAGGTGGGVDLLNGSSVAVLSSVFAGNTAASGADIGETGTNSVIGARSSFFQTSPAVIDVSTANVIGSDPLLGALANNGGPVMTRTPLNGSPLIGAGNVADLIEDIADVDGDRNTAEKVPLDAANNPRVIGTLDIGAVEFAPPVIGSGATASVAENTTAVTTVTTTDPTNQSISYSIFGGVDAAKFGINATTGALAFLAAPDFETPTDAGGNNVYDVVVRATDASGLTADKAIAVSVTDVAETPAGGSDTHTLPSGGMVSGTAAQLFGDTVSGLGTAGIVRFTDSVAKLSDLIISGNEIRLASAGPNSAPLTLDGDFSDGRFFLVKNASGGADLFFQKNLVDDALVEGRALSEAEVNGAPHPAALTGDGSVRFQVTLSEKATAAHTNALGVYEIDASGNIVDVRLLFTDVKAAGAGTVTVDGVEAGHKLGFFIVADGVDAGVSSGAVSFVDISGGSPDLADAANLRLQIGGRTVDATVFHAYDRSLNGDGLTHARSGADPSGHGVRVAFEDLASGGDRDFQDVVFRVDMVDGNGDFLV